MPDLVGDRESDRPDLRDARRHDDLRAVADLDDARRGTLEIVEHDLRAERRRDVVDVDLARLGGVARDEGTTRGGLDLLQA